MIEKTNSLILTKLVILLFDQMVLANGFFVKLQYEICKGSIMFGLVAIFQGCRPIII